MTYESTTVIESSVAAGVTYTVARMSFGRRLELMRRIRELTGRIEFLDAGQQTGQRMEAAVLRAEIDRLYVMWGLRDIAGLDVDGQRATPELLAEAGPEDLFREAVAAVRAATGLTEAARKN